MLAGSKPPAGALSIEGGRGVIVIRGNGGLLGRVSHGSVEVVDLSPGDAWRPAVNGVTRLRRSVSKGANLSFRILGGDYRITIKGEGISVSARGNGVATLLGVPSLLTQRHGHLLGRSRSRLPGHAGPVPDDADHADPGVVRQDRHRIDDHAPVTQPPTILVVEDEASIASFVALYLKNAGYQVKAVGTGSAALNQVAAGMPSMIILDLNLPDMDGIEICRRIRKSSDVPILMLTARDEDVDKIIGLEVGADDYLTKPFNPRELVARVKSVLRRSAPEKRRDESKELSHGELVINAGKREVYVGDDEIQLAPKEFDLLWELLDHRGLVLTRDQLLERVWGYTFAGDTRTVDVHVRQIRRKLGDASPIVTVWGVGYKVQSDRTPAPTG